MENERLEKTAGIANKDKNTLSYDQSSKSFIDIDDILESNLKISNKINNLIKYGVSLEQIKTVYEMIGNTQGKNVDEIIEELEKVFDIFVNKINSDPNIGIVLDIDNGEKDIELSIQKCEDFGIEYEGFEKKPISEKTKMIDEIINVIAYSEKSNLIKYNEDINYSFEDIVSHTNNYREPTDEDFSDMQNNLNMNDNEKKDIEKLLKYINITKKLDLDFIKSIYNYVDMYQRDSNSNKLEDALNQIKELFKDPLNKYARFLVDENGEITQESIIKFKKEWEEKKNLADTYSDLGNILVALEREKEKEKDIDFDKLNPIIKEKIILALSKAEIHSSSKIIKNQRDFLLEKLNMSNLDKGTLWNYIYTTLGIKINNEEDFNKFVSSHEFNSNTCHIKFMRILQNLENPENENKSYCLNTNLLSVDNIHRSLKEKEIFKILTENYNRKSDGIHDYKGLEIINLYNIYYREGGKKDDIKQYMDTYILQYREYFEEYFKNIDTEGIFNKDGSVSITRIQQILQRNLLPESVKRNTIIMKGELDSKKKEIGRIKEKSQKFIEKLSEINADKLTFEDESTIVDILEKMNLGALDEALISKLKSYHSDRINDILDKELKNDINVRLIPQSMKSITIEEAERENILLLQAKIEYSKGTADYENNLAIMKEYLTQYPESSQLVKDFRNIYGELTGQGVTELKSYVNNLLNETIKYNINATNVEGLDTEERKNFTSILILGIENDDPEIRINSIEKFKKMFQGFSKINDYEQLKEKMYHVVYGNSISDDFYKKNREIKRNLIRKILNEKDIIDLNKLKINDKETEDFFERIAVPIKTTETDLTKSEIKNRFKGSVIDFSEKDETIFKELYCDTTVNSWISDKSNVTRYEIIYLKKFLSENNEKSPESQRSNQKYFKRLNRLLRENPDFKEKFENDEEFANKIVSEAKTFGKNKLVSDLLENFQKDILVKAENYSKLIVSDKKNVLRYAMFASKFAETIENPDHKALIQKLSDRTLELMNSKEKNFISFDVNGKRVINENSILEEINSVAFSKKQCTSYEEARNLVAKRHENFYVPSQLYSFSRLDEKYFTPLNEENRIKKLLEIEKRKVGRITELLETSSRNKHNTNRNSNQIERSNEDETKREKIPPESEFKDNNAESNSSLKIEEIDLSIINEKKYRKTGFMERVKDTIKRIKTKKLTDGNALINRKTGVLGKLVNGVKNIFLKREKFENENKVSDSIRKSQIEYKEIQNTFDERIKVEGLNHQRAINELHKSSEKTANQEAELTVE